MGLNRKAQNTQALETPTDDIVLKASTPYMIDVDPRKVVSLIFENVHAVVSPWEREYVRVTPNEYFEKYVELLNEHNLILFDYESYHEENLFMSDRAGFVVKVPKSAVLAIIAGDCVVRDCIVISVQSDKLEINDCILVDNFRFIGNDARVQNSTIGNHGSFSARTMVMRHSTCSTLILMGNEKSTHMSVELRNVRGKSVWLGSKQVRRIDARLHHVRLNRLVVDAAIEDGNVILEGKRIARIKNNSSIPIVKSVLGHRRKCS
jgi:hypothetical protein